MDYDERYAEVEDLFGREPEETLRQFADRLPAAGRVLDVGAGQGRNALFLARRGLSVHALEPSDVAAATLAQASREEGLPIKVLPATFEDFALADAPYDGILVFGLIQDLPWPAIRRLVRSLAAWSGPGALVWITGFTTADPAFALHRDAWQNIGEHSFRDDAGQTRTYLAPGQILDLFSRWQALHHWEGLGPEHRHGDGPLERHGKFEAVFAKARAAGLATTAE